MSKIVKAVNAMVENSNKINNVIKGQSSTEYFFKYSDRYNWSIFQNASGYHNLIFYPDSYELSYLASIPDHVWDDENIESISYNTKELATKEAAESFKELYSIVKEKVYGMDSVLDDIIDDAFPF